MAEIGFYHLLSAPLERALAKLLERASSQGYRIVVRAASLDRVEHLNASLWTYEEGSFLPHGSARDGKPEMQPIWLTHRDEIRMGLQCSSSLTVSRPATCNLSLVAPISSTATTPRLWRRRAAAGDAPAKRGTN